MFVKSIELIWILMYIFNHLKKKKTKQNKKKMIMSEIIGEQYSVIFLD